MNIIMRKGLKNTFYLRKYELKIKVIIIFP